MKPVLNGKMRLVPRVLQSLFFSFKQKYIVLILGSHINNFFGLFQVQVGDVILKVNETDVIKYSTREGKSHLELLLSSFYHFTSLLLNSSSLSLPKSSLLKDLRSTNSPSNFNCFLTIHHVLTQ